MKRASLVVISILSPGLLVGLMSGRPAAAMMPVAGLPVIQDARPFVQVQTTTRRRTSRTSRRSRRSVTAPRASDLIKKSGPAPQQTAALNEPGDITRLFGTTEKRSDKLKAFKKWNGAAQKMADEQADLEKFKNRFKDWVEFLETLRDKDQMTQINEVNRFMNKSKYILDQKNWGVKDYWASPGEFRAKFGDCEDYSIAKYMALKYLGHNPDNMRIVALKDTNLKVGHAILAYYLKDRIIILDNQIKVTVDSRSVRHYLPVYSINEKYWWRHRPAV